MTGKGRRGGLISKNSEGVSQRLRFIIVEVLFVFQKVQGVQDLLFHFVDCVVRIRAFCVISCNYCEGVLQIVNHPYYVFFFHFSVILSDYPIAVAVYGSGLLSCCEFLEVLGCYIFEVPAHDVTKSRELP